MSSSSVVGRFSKSLASKHLLRACITILSVFFLQACGQGNEQGFLEAVAVNKQQITSLSVVSVDDSQRVRVGETQAFTAIANIAGGTSSDISSRVSWSSSDPSIVTVNGNGVATGVLDGTVQIVAQYSDLSATTSLKSSSANVESISVTNPNVSLSLCDTASLPLKAVASYTDGDTDDVTDQVSWESSDSSTVFVGNEDLTGSSDGLRSDKGMISSLSTGDAVVTASQDDIEGTVAITVTADDFDSGSLTITPPSALYADETYTFTASASYGNNSDDRRDISGNLTWSSSNESALAFPDSTNSANALAAADVVTVTATCAPGDPNVGDASDGEKATVDVEVEPARSVTGIQIEFGTTIINDGTVNEISVDLSEAEIQLEAYIIYSDGVDSSNNIADDDETTWSYVDTETGETAEISNEDGTKGTVSFDAVGSTQFKVRTTVGGGAEKLFYIKVES